VQVSIAMVRALASAVERAGGSRERFLALSGLDPRPKSVRPPVSV
jgi:hypothetical protein